MAGTRTQGCHVGVTPHGWRVKKALVVPQGERGSRMLVPRSLRSPPVWLLPSSQPDSHCFSRTVDGTHHT